MREWKGVVWGFSWLGATDRSFWHKKLKRSQLNVCTVYLYRVLFSPLWLKFVSGWPAISVSTWQQLRMGQIVWFGWLHCKKSWRKTPPGWPDVTNSLVRGTENFFYMQIELIRRVPTMTTEYFDISGIFLLLIWRVLTMLTDYFDINGIFLRFSILTRRSFPTIFRQLSDK